MISNKTIVLTGADSGIGLEVLKLLASEKSNKILAVDINCRNMDKCGDNVITYQCDVSSKEAVDSIFEKAISDLGSIDIFYANAGYPYYEIIDYTDWDRTKRMFETNVFSPIYTYEKYKEYLGLGLNSQSFMFGKRFSNIKNLGLISLIRLIASTTNEFLSVSLFFL